VSAFWCERAWTGERLYVWGGRGRFDTRSEFLADGAFYEPANDRWTPLSPSPLSPRADPVVVWLADRRALPTSRRRRDRVCRIHNSGQRRLAPRL
jgi:transglutaminase-like putative cysteine protease